MFSLPQKYLKILTNTFLFVSYVIFSNNLYSNSEINLWNSKLFPMKEDYFTFYDSQSKTVQVSLPNIKPRSYIFCIDFTFGSKNGVRVIELNGPNYPIGFTNNILFKTLYLKSVGSFRKIIGDRNWNIPYYSGSSGHEGIYGSKFSLKYLENRNWLKLSSTLGLDPILTEELSSVDTAHRANNSMIQNIYPESQETLLEWQRIENEHSKSLILNHPEVKVSTGYKSLLSILPFVPHTSIPQLILDRRHISIEEVNSFLDKSNSSYYILKPSNSDQSKGVVLLHRDQVPSYLGSRKTSNYRYWILQSYMPSDPILLESGKLTSPVGRAFYSVSLYNGKMQIEPLTVYFKIGKYQTKNYSDFYDPSLVNFSAISNSIEPESIRDLSTIINHLNTYVTKISPSLFQLSQHGLEAKSPVGIELNQRFHQLSSRERYSIKEMLHRYYFASVIRRDNEVNMYGNFFESPIYNSLKNYPRHCSKVWEK